MSRTSIDPGRSRDDAVIEQTAAEWFGRCEIGLTPAEEAEFLRWLEADERHGQAMREMDETWEFLDGLRQLRRPGWAASQLRSAAPAPRRRGFRWMLMATAAVFVLTMPALWLARSDGMDRQAATETGGMKKLELRDGSVVHLNGNSRVHIRFTAGERRVELLHGEAHFAVAKDPARPFVVAAGEVKVRAVGTAFNVRLETKAVDVLVLEGQVRLDHAATGGSLLAKPMPAPASAGEVGSSSPVTAAGDEALLRAGQRALVNRDETVSPQAARVHSVAPAELERAVAWQALQLDFDLTPLAEIVAQFNRHNSHQLVIADPELAAQLFGGTFRADNCDGFVQLLEQRFGVKAERSRDRTVLRRARP